MVFIIRTYNELPWRKLNENILKYGLLSGLYTELDFCHNKLMLFYMHGSDKNSSSTKSSCHMWKQIVSHP